MEKKTMLTFGLFAVLIVAIAVLSVGYANRASNEEVLAVVNDEISKVQVQNAEVLDELVGDYNEKLVQAQEDAKAELDAALAAEQAANDVAAAEMQAALDAIYDELSAAKDELATDAKTDELYSLGKVIDGIFLESDGLHINLTLDDGDLSKLIDSEILFNDDKYDVHEEFGTTGTSFLALYSFMNGEEFGANPYLGLKNKGELEYRFLFDDPINMTAVSDDEPLRFSFLGSPVEVVDVDSHEVTFRSGESFLFREGESKEFDGKTVTLIFVGDNGKVSVSVDNDTAILEEFDSETIGGLDVRVEDIMVNSREGLATLVLGEDILFVQKSGDEWLNEDSSFKFEIKFEIVNSTGYLEGFVISYEEKREELDDEFPALGLGDSIVFPSDYITVRFDNVRETDYIMFDFEYDEFDEEINDVDVTNKDCMVISTDNNDIIIGKDEANEAYICKNGSAYYQGSNDDWYDALVTEVSLVNDDITFSLKIGTKGGFNGTETGKYMRLQSGIEIIKLNNNWDEQCFGVFDDEAEKYDVIYKLNLNNSTWRGLGNFGNDLLTPYGTVIYDVENNAEDNIFSIGLPTGRVELELFVY